MADNVNNLPEVTEDVATPTDNPIDRMIDIALEAQDGKPETTTEEKTGTTEVVAPANGEDSTGGNSNDKSQSQPNKEGTQAPQQTHGAKDLTLGDGTVVKGGAERRFYEQRETARQQAEHYKKQADTTSQRVTTLESELQSLRQTTESLRGVDPQTLQIGAAIVTDLQRDPVGTMKKLLAEVVAQGHSIESIGVGVDTLAIQRMIDERLPANQQNEPTEQEILQQAQHEVNNFYGSHPDARPHDNVLGRMLRDNPGVDLDTAYFELKNAFAEKGFDWSRSLEDNLKETSSPTTPQPPQQQQMPNGRPMTPNVSNANEVKVAHEDTDMSDIVRAAMRESGLQV